MADSFQNEIPKARINITLDVETEGAKKKKELPLKMLVLGDFSNGKAEGTVAERKPIDINKNNFDKVMKDLKAELNFTVPNHLKDDGSEMKVDLSMECMKQFNPEQIYQQVPELKNLMSMRNLLKDLKANLLDNTKFRKELEKIVKNKPELEGLRNELQKIAPIHTDAITES